DYLITSVNLPMVAMAHELAKKTDVRHVRLRPMPHPQLAYPAEGFGEIRKRSRYSLSLQPGIWEPQVLYNLCRDHEDPWQTEIQGSGRVREFKGKFLSTDKQPIITHHNYYRKGKPQGAGWVRKNVPKVAWPDAAKRG
ncbi:MAG: hypothetical protein ACXAEN_20700, partial [Candidatus Thorarchaeota archaeon]